MFFVKVERKRILSCAMLNVQLFRVMMVLIKEHTKGD